MPGMDIVVVSWRGTGECWFNLIISRWVEITGWVCQWTSFTIFWAQQLREASSGCHVTRHSHHWPGDHISLISCLTEQCCLLVEDGEVVSGWKLIGHCDTEQQCCGLQSRPAPRRLLTLGQYQVTPSIITICKCKCTEWLLSRTLEANAST